MEYSTYVEENEYPSGSAGRLGSGAEYCLHIVQKGGLLFTHSTNGAMEFVAETLDGTEDLFDR